jgi:retron-type reverse transcriptase
MKRYGNLYPQVWDFENLLRAARQAQKGKRFTSGCRNFNLDLEKHLVRLQRELQNQSYRPGQYNHFRIYEPKKRLISAAPYEDRVVHHALVNVIEPFFERAMIADSYANRLGKGTHKAVDRFTQFARKRRYVLKMDVVRYFPSLDHDLLRGAIAKKVKDKEILWLIGLILDSGLTAEFGGSPNYFPGDDLFTPLSRKRGLPIGNLTSQFFANVYLDGFDHYVKEDLGCKCYIRYMDDMVVFDDSKRHLHELRKTMLAELEHLRLRVHLNKAQIWPVQKGTDWLGYRVYPTHRRVRKSNIKRFRGRLQVMAEGYCRGEIELEKVKASILSWLGHVKHADSYHLRQDVLGKVFFQRG